MRPKNLLDKNGLSAESTQIMSETTNAFLDNIVEGNMKVRKNTSNLIATLEVVYKILLVLPNKNYQIFSIAYGFEVPSSLYNCHAISLHS